MLTLTPLVTPQAAWPRQARQGSATGLAWTARLPCPHPPRFLAFQATPLRHVRMQGATQTASLAMYTTSFFVPYFYTRLWNRKSCLSRYSPARGMHEHYVSTYGQDNRTSREIYMPSHHQRRIMNPDEPFNRSQDMVRLTKGMSLNYTPHRAVSSSSGHFMHHGCVAVPLHIETCSNSPTRSWQSLRRRNMNISDC